MLRVAALITRPPSGALDISRLLQLYKREQNQARGSLSSAEGYELMSRCVVSVTRVESLSEFRGCLMENCAPCVTSIGVF